MSRLRWPLRIYILAVLAAALAALPASAAVRADLRPTDTVLLAVVTAMAAVAQLWPVHISMKVKLTVDDTATFTAAILLGPFYAMVAAGASTLLALHFRGRRQRWYNVGFNAASSVLATGAAATVYALTAGTNGPVVSEPGAVLAAAVTKYVVNATLLDVVVSLQLQRSPFTGWWRMHSRLFPYETALLFLGALGAIAAQSQPWALVLFGVPMAVVLLTLRDSARVREQTKSAVLELADLVDLRDPYTRGHSERVADLAARLARRLNLEYGQIDRLRDAARVHDIGKVGTSDFLLQKAGPLTKEEQAEMRSRAEIGYRLLKRLPGLWEGAELAAAQHERYDGTGYPRGLTRDELPVEVSVISIADAYDAMTAGRPYRRRLNWDEVRAELVRQRGKQWREAAVDEFIEMIEEERRAPRAEPALTPGTVVSASRPVT